MHAHTHTQLYNYTLGTRVLNQRRSASVETFTQIIFLPNIIYPALVPPDFPPLACRIFLGFPLKSRVPKTGTGAGAEWERYVSTQNALARDETTTFVLLIATLTNTCSRLVADNRGIRYYYHIYNIYDV